MADLTPEQKTDRLAELKRKLKASEGKEGYKARIEAIRLAIAELEAST